VRGTPEQIERARAILSSGKNEGVKVYQNPAA
jgi:hypothetical protein